MSYLSDCLKTITSIDHIEAIIFKQLLQMTRFFKILVEIGLPYFQLVHSAHNSQQEYGA